MARFDPGKYRRLLIGLAMAQAVVLGIMLATGLLTTRSYERLIGDYLAERQGAAALAAVDVLLWDEHIALAGRVAGEIAREVQPTLAAGDTAALAGELAEVYRRGAISSGQILVSGVSVHGLDGTVLAEDWRDSSASGLAREMTQPLGARTDAERLRPLLQSQRVNGRPVTSLAVPAGGLRPIGYVALHFDPVGALTGLDTRLATDVRIETIEGEPLLHPGNVAMAEDATIGDSRVVIEAPEGGALFAVEVLYDTSSLSGGLVSTRNLSLMTILIAGGGLALVLVGVFWVYLARANAREEEANAREETLAQEVAARNADEVARAAEREREQQAAAEATAREAAVTTRVVNELGAALSRLAEGDLTVRIASLESDPFPQHYDSLRGAFNDAVEQLEILVAQLGEVAGNIKSGSAEISGASGELARRAETQAATLEQSSAALHELTESVRATADRVASAEGASQDNRLRAEDGVQVVRDAVTAMSEIEQSSARISQIIGVIEDIAFQTNLLALNAGVEAARAGDAGRGFAVVASEVRLLAQKTSENASEIKSLISESVAQVENGSTLVRRTGESLEGILGRAAEVQHLLVEIASAAGEQATGIDEINTSVGQLDNVTQHNAAAAEEAAAAAVNLSRSADDLAEAIGRFRIALTSRHHGAPAEQDLPHLRAVG